jgi:hypothetical protein
MLFGVNRSACSKICERTSTQLHRDASCHIVEHKSRAAPLGTNLMGCRRRSTLRTAPRRALSDSSDWRASFDKQRAGTSPLPLAGQDSRGRELCSTGCAALHPWLQAVRPCRGERGIAFTRGYRLCAPAGAREGLRLPVAIGCAPIAGRWGNAGGPGGAWDCSHEWSGSVMATRNSWQVHRHDVCPDGAKESCRLGSRSCGTHRVAQSHSDPRSPSSGGVRIVRLKPLARPHHHVGPLSDFVH